MIFDRLLTPGIPRLSSEIFLCEHFCRADEKTVSASGKPAVSRFMGDISAGKGILIADPQTAIGPVGFIECRFRSGVADEKEFVGALELPQRIRVDEHLA